MKDAKKELKELVKEAEDNLDDLKEDLERKEYKTAKNLLKAAKNCSRSMSVNNLKKFASAVNKIGDLDSDDLGVLDGIGNAVGDSILSILKIISTVVLIGMLFALAFSACGGFLKIRGLVITGMIFSVIYAAIFCGFLFVLLFTAVHIALYIFIGKAKQEIAAEKAAI